MKTTNTKSVLVASLCGLMLGAAPLLAQNVGQWDFNQSNLVQTAGATLGDLAYIDAATGTTSNKTVFGSTTVLGLPAIAGTPAQVMGFPGGAFPMGYYMPTPPANDGGSLVNTYTVIFDVLYTNANSLRPLIQMDDGTLDNIKAYFGIGSDGSVQATNTSGAKLPSTFSGALALNTWYRLGFTFDWNSGLLSVYTNGSPLAIVHVFGPSDGSHLDSPYALLASSQLPILSSTITNAPGFVNSIQVRDSVLNAGQMDALGGPTAAGIPITLPPAHSFIVSRSPDIGQAGIGPEPTINVVIDQGAATINMASITLSFDGVVQPSAIVAAGNPNQYTVAYYQTNTVLDPLSVHTLQLAYTDSIQGAKTYTWTFAVAGYQNIALPSPIPGTFEDFEGVTEGVTITAGSTNWNLPAGWSVFNETTHETSGFDLTDGSSDAWLNWLVVNTDRLEQIASGEDGTYTSPTPGYTYTPILGSATGPRRLISPPIVVNGVLLDSLAHGNVIDADSDQRCNGCFGQYNVLFTRDYDCTGYTNVYVKWNSLYEQNQDNIGAVEYSVDQGVTWLPVLYMLDDGVTDGDGSDVVTNGGTGQIDVLATFGTPRNDQAGTLAYSNFIGTVVSPANYVAIAAATQGRKNDDPLASKRIEIYRLPLADNNSHVRFRFAQAGTSSWYFGIDDFGLYSITLPVITGQPSSLTVDANTPASFSVTASGGPFTYQWKFNGQTITNATSSAYSIASAVPANAGLYTVVVRNSSGPVTSSPAQLTVNTNPVFAITPAGEIADPCATVTFNASATGGRPLTYKWLFNGSQIASSTVAPLTLSNVQSNNIGSYQVVAMNSYGAITSPPASLKVYAGALSNSLVVHLTFDGNLADTSGRGNNATYEFNGASAKSSATFASGKLGQAFQVTTMQDSSAYEYASLGYPDDLKFGDTNDFSISFWAQYTYQGDDIPFISNKDWDSSSNPGWGLFTQGGGNYRINVTGPNGGADKFSQTDTPQVLKNGNWHHIAVSVQKAPFTQQAFVYGYLDGVLVSKHAMNVAGTLDTDGQWSNHQTSSPVPTPIETTFQVNIGQDGTGLYTDNHGGHLIALLDDMGIWRRALTANEVTGIYTAGNQGKDLSQVITPAILCYRVVGPNLVITWPANPVLKLQKTTTLAPASWVDVPGTLGAGSASVPLSDAPAFFKLAK
jgi:hypothetical protein